MYKRTRKPGILLLLLTLATALQAQDVEWAHRVLGYSSEASYSAYSAKQILGEPNKLPASGDAGTAWAPGAADANGERYIKVGFRNPIRVRQVLVAETNQAGSVEAIYIYDRNNRESLVYKEGSGAQVDRVGSLMRLRIKETRHKVHAVKVVMKNRPGWDRDQLDAIGISNSEEPWEPQIAVTGKYHYPGELTPLGGGVNSEYSEIYPRISPDGERLYFCRKNHPDNYGFDINDDIWYADRNADNTWGEAVNAGWPINDQNHNYVCAISEDGNMLTLGNGYRFDRSPMPGISQTIRSGKDWIEPLNLKVDGLTILNMNAEYAINSSRTVLVLAIESWDSKGKKDLYVSFSKDQIHWSAPVNMGPQINSAGKEMAPFISEDGKTIFFSSDGFPGYGSQDIYLSERLDDSWTNWSAPENLGPEVNSPFWDSYFFYSARTGTALLASNRDHYTNENIYTLRMEHKQEDREETLMVATAMAGLGGPIISMPSRSSASAQPRTEAVAPVPKLQLTGGVYDAESGEILHAQIRFVPVKVAGSTVNMNTGKTLYKVNVIDGAPYKVEVSAPGYFSRKVQLRAEDAHGKGSMRKDFELIPIRAGQTIALENVYFDVNSSTLQQQSFEVLDQWVDILHDQPNVTIEVSGHTNNRCSPRYCLDLSRRRAQSVANYLEENGILNLRLSYRGYGSEAPVASNNSSSGRKKNQRVEFKILSTD